jgi:hypothetical protein
MLKTAKCTAKEDTALHMHSCLRGRTRNQLLKPCWCLAFREDPRCIVYIVEPTANKGI